MRDNAVRYLPAEFISEVEFLDLDDSDDARWKISRLLERAYAQGYDEGHGRGRREGWASGRKVARAEVEKLQLQLGGVEGERDANEDALTSIRDALGVPDEVDWGNVVSDRIKELLARESGSGDTTEEEQ